MATNYTAEVFAITKDITTGEGTLILSLDGKLSAKSKREITDQIANGRVTVRERVRRIA